MTAGSLRIILNVREGGWPSDLRIHTPGTFATFLRKLLILFFPSYEIYSSIHSKKTLDKSLDGLAKHL